MKTNYNPSQVPSKFGGSARALPDKKTNTALKTKLLKFC
jgi:hypothetical protein